MALTSIITPNYNSENYIEYTYASIAQQTNNNWEWIIIDDGSTDHSLSIIRDMCSKDDRITLVQNSKNLGPAKSRNKGIKMAKGKYLTFIDSDDVWFPNFIEESINHLTIQGAHFVFSSYERWNEDFSKKIDTFKVPNKVSKSDLLKTCSISCLTAFIDIGTLGKKYMPNLKKRQDFGLWLDYLSQIDSAYGIQPALAKYRLRKASVSSNKLKVIKYQFEIYRKYEKLSLFKSLYYLIHWALNGLKKYSFKLKLKK